MIKKILLKLLSKDIEKMTTVAFNNGQMTEKMQDRQNRAKFARIAIEDMIGKPVIILVNEWSNPVVGELIAAHFKNEDSIHPLYEVQNYITGEATCSLCAPLAFSMQKLQALGKMDPDEMVALFHEGKDRFYTYHKHPTYGKNPEELENFYTNFDDWMEKLTKNGFFDKFGSFLHDEEEKAEAHWKGVVASYR